ncbi:aspartate-semialdehyde dehydrogenase [Parafrankia irregularis]|uniref:Aspartate-semialdehyde dehydrogenase n=1 Tax=Parafrankia irregularis TaxID=795642 RepID=A0A0S4QKU5_9ACTN|nr:MULTISPECIES: aspartate-semialdehyde dehydrogenase [Parafrankia]MBE3205680.1 aspartate-semialdehyde dehydrogenase [Parafrankia sp. CH37]CUU55420.1 aspartate-semialdehyde dehydrogenase [Parafrankia irregularis]
MNIAVIGATGVVGKQCLQLLDAGALPGVERVIPVASGRSAGRDLTAEYGLDLKVEPVVALADFDPAAADLAGLDLAIFSAGAPISLELGPKVAAAGALVVDNSSAFRMEDDVPLVVPQVNPHTMATRPARGIASVPNCSTIQLVRALHPLRALGNLERLVVASYQAASGGGLRGLEELASTSREVLDGGEPAETPSRFGRTLAFNLVPEIGLRDDAGISHEEHKLRREPRKILDLPALRVAATAVRVPVVNGHSEAVHITFDRPVTAADALDALRAAPGVRAYGEDEGYPRPRQVCSSVESSSLVHVGRIRADLDDPCSLLLWVVADNLMVGAALTAVEIARLATESTWM